MAAELRLGVSFDLVYFRQQLQKLNQIAASEFTAKVKLGIDKRDFQRQFNAISRDLRININDSQIEAAQKRLANLNRSIATARQAANTPIVYKVRYEQEGAAPRGAAAASGTFRQRLAALDKTELAKLYQAAGEASGKGFEKGILNNKRDLVRALGDIGEDSVAGLLNGIKSSDPALQAAAKSLGKNLINSMKAVLGIASPSKEFKKLGDASGEGFEQGLKSGLGEAARMGVQEMRSLFRALQGEAQSGAARLQATMLAAMAGLVQLPGGRQQRGRLMQTGAGINAAMTGSALGNIQARQGAVRGAAQGAAATTPTFAAALPLMFGMDPRELTARLQGLYGQQYRAPAMGGYQAPRPGRISALINALASARGNLSPAAGVNQRLFTGGAANPGVLASGYIGRSALSAGFVNYPPGMPAAYGTGFIGGGAGSYGMAPGRMQGPALPVRGVFSTASGSLGQFPSAGMMGPASPRGSMGQFPMAGMAYPSSPLGVITPQSSMFGGGGFGGGGGGGGGRGGFNFPSMPAPINMPGLGTAKQVGDEFAFAAKQVLLFGTAYKALAFLTGFPAQVGEAVAQLQSFRNTLNAITPSAQEAAASSAFIAQVVEKYNIPLESARSGFTKLYASMAPAGFSGEEIRNLFLGVSQAAATFGMSSEKVDRVNYAFAQMASKGQIMSEELKGQLGDVLPGAMGIFAKAAGYTGKNAIQEFGKAMEDGAFKGEVARKILQNVAIDLQTNFAAGAQGAANTYQGSMNRMNNATKLFYEAFEPLATGFLNSFVTPFIGGLKTVTDGVTAFFQQTKAKSAGGAAFAAELEKLRPVFAGIQQNITSLIPILKQFLGIAIELGKVFLSIAGNPITGALLKLYLVALPLVGAFNLAMGALRVFQAQMLLTNMSALTAGASVFKLRGIMELTGLSARGAATAVTAFGTALKLALNVGVMAVIGLMIGRFMELKGAIDSVRQSTQQMLGSISSMANAGDIKGLGNVGRDITNQIKTFEQLKALSKTAFGVRQLTAEQAKLFQSVGLGGYLSKTIFGVDQLSDAPRALTVIEARLQGLYKQHRSVGGKMSLAQSIANQIAADAASANQRADVQGSLAGGDGKAADKAQEAALKALDDRRKYEADLMKLNAEQAMALDAAAFDHWKSLEEQKAALRSAGADSWMKYELDFQNKLQQIELARIETVRKAREEAQKAEVEAAAAAYAASGGGASGLPAGVSGYITGDPSSRFYKADHGGQNYHEHLSFVSRQAAEEAYRKLTGAGITVTEFMGYSNVGRHTPGSKHYSGLAFDVPAAQVPVGQETQLTARVQSILGFPGAASAGDNSTRGRTEAKQENRASLEAVRALNAAEREGLAIRQANELAQQRVNAAIAEYVSGINPVAQTQLENQLLAQKNQLLLQGMSSNVLDNEMKMYEARERTRIGIENANNTIKANNAAVAAGKMSADQAAIANKNQEKTITDLNTALAAYLGLLQQRPALEAQGYANQQLGMYTRESGIYGQGLSAGFMGEAGSAYEEALRQGVPPETASRVAEAARSFEMLKFQVDMVKGALEGMESSFAQSLSSVIQGTSTAQQALGEFFGNIGKMFADMAAKMIAKWLFMQAIGLVGSLFPGGGNLFQQTSGYYSPTTGLGTRGPNFGLANGGIINGSFMPITPFANGGMVSGPTLGLVGEGRFNEAVVPLPNGKSIPVDLGEGAGNNIATNITVNVSNGQAQSSISGNGGTGLAKQLDAAVKEVILRETRPGGIIYSRR